jgi:hypothetical protein
VGCGSEAGAADAAVDVVDVAAVVGADVDVVAVAGDIADVTGASCDAGVVGAVPPCAVRDAFEPHAASVATAASCSADILGIMRGTLRRSAGV